MRRSLSTLMILALPATAGLAACSSGGDSSAQSGHSTSSSSAAAKGAVPGTVSDTKTVAVVNGHKIKGAAFNRMLTQVHLQDEQQAQQGQAAPSPSAKEEKKQAIDTVVGTELLAQAADAHGYKTSKKSVDQQISSVKKQYPTKKKLQQALKKNHLTMGELRSEIGNQLKIQAYVKKELGPFTVSNQQITTYYAQLKQQAKAGGGKSSLPPLKKVKPQIKQQLQNEQQQQKVRSQVAKLKKKGDVNILI